MTIIDRIKNALYPESNLSAPEKWLAEMFGSNKGITEETALEVTACYSCVRIIAEQIAILPVNLYQEETDKGRTKQKQHNVYRLLNIEPNPYMTAYNFWMAMMVQKLLTGFGYAEVERDRKTKAPIALWPIPTKYVTKKKNSRGEPVYEVKINADKPKMIAYGNMLEIQGVTPDGYSVYEPIQLLKNALGLSRSAELFSKEYFDEGTHPSGVITYPGALRAEKQEEFRKQVKNTYSGLGKHHRVMLLEDGMKFDRITAPPNEGQMYESRQFQVIEICRFFNVPPHKVMDMSRATWGNMEESNIQFVNDSLLPHLINNQQSIYQTLLFDFEKRDGLYAEYDLNNLLRGRLQDRFESYAKARQWGWLNVNEIRAKENMSSIGPQGDIYIEPLNMQEAGKGGSE